MDITVIGPGALGCLVAAAISGKKNGNRLWLLDHNPERAAVLSQTGLLLEEDDRRFHFPVRATADPADIGRTDLILLCVKSNAVQAALEQAARLTSPDSLLITLQNGIGHLPVLESAGLQCAVALGVTAQGAHLIPPNHVRHAGRGITRIGFAAWGRTGADPAALEQAATLLSGAGINTEVSDSIIEHIWLKLLINVGINALTAILSCPNGQLLENPAARSQLTKAVLEAAAVARAKGISIPGDPVEKTMEVCRATADNISSMLQDVRKKKITEIDAINGAVIAEGHRLGIALPANQALVRQIKEIEQNY